jgi:hypothetical protein
MEYPLVQRRHRPSPDDANGRFVTVPAVEGSFLQLAGSIAGSSSIKAHCICANVPRLPLQEQDQALLPLQPSCRRRENSDCSGMNLPSRCGPICHTFRARPVPAPPTSSRFGQLRRGAPLARSMRSRLAIPLFRAAYASRSKPPVIPFIRLLLPSRCFGSSSAVCDGAVVFIHDDVGDQDHSRVRRLCRRALAGPNRAHGVPPSLFRQG